MEYSTDEPPMNFFQQSGIDWQDVTLNYRKLISYYECAAMELETKLQVLNKELSLYYDKNPIESIGTRIKLPASIARKLDKKAKPYTTESIEENIWDIAGLRVVCSFPEDVYLVEKYLLKQDDIRLIERKDYIKNPKESGYRSLHLIVEVPIFLHNEKKWVKAEIQIRTMAMDFWASLEHKIRYKKNLPPDVDREVARSLKRAAKACAALDAEMETIRNQIQQGKDEKKED